VKINQIIDKIDERHLFVPAFQREYVWKRKDAKNLIYSLLKDYPTGTMLTWETTNPPELKGDYAYESTKGAVKLILDGQQRITTLYLLIKGEIPPYYQEKEILNDIRGLHVHLESLSLEYYKKTMMDGDPLWVNITDVFRNDITPWNITDQLDLEDQGEKSDGDRRNTIWKNIASIQQIKDREFLEQVVPTKASIKEAIDIFYIVNASGVNLTDAELALAQISGYWPTARAEFKVKLEELKSRGWVFSLDFIVYALLAVMYQQGSKMNKLHGADNKDNIQQAWKTLEHKVLDYVCNQLQSHAYVDHTDEINSVYALIPIITYTYQRPNHKLTEEEINKIIKWFYYSQIKFRYISQLRQRLDKDIGIVTRSEKPFDELLNLIEEERPLAIKPSDFVGRNIAHPLFSMMRWYFKSKGAVCLAEGVKLQQNMGKNYGLERDHIFAYSRLRDSTDADGNKFYDMDDRFDYSLAQEVTNRAILTLKGNRNKSAMNAEKFLTTVKNSFPSALEMQCIPDNKNLWRIENFKAFLQKRRGILADELNAYLENISITTSVTKSERSIEEIIQSGEDRFLEFKSTLRWNLRESKVDKKMEDVIVKTIAAFSNGEGGRLLIGVADNGEVLGLQDDFNSLKEANKDHFGLHLNNLINAAFGKDFSLTNIQVDFPIINDEEICEILIEKGRKPLYVEVTNPTGQKQKKLFVRSTNSSQDLDLEESTNYIQERFDFGNQSAGENT